MSVTLKEVAQLAGVSPITVSRTFGNAHPVAPETRRRVLAAAAELGYTPNLLARGMVQKRTPVIGMVVPELADPFFTSIIDAAQSVAQRWEHMLIINQSERRVEVEQASIHSLRQIQAAGLLVTSISRDMKHVNEVREAGMAVVAVARRWGEGDYVTVDDYRGGALAGEHLTELGHRTIGYLAWRESGNSALQARLKGFRAAVRRGGGTVPATHVLMVDDLHPSSGALAAEMFCALSPRPTAMFIAADWLAIGFANRLRQLGARIPDDVAIIGYDDIQYAEYLEVPLTTIAQPKHELGTRAAELLMERIQSSSTGEVPRHIEMEPTLIIRSSCGGKKTATHGHAVKQVTLEGRHACR